MITSFSPSYKRNTMTSFSPSLMNVVKEARGKSKANKKKQIVQIISPMTTLRSNVTDAPFIPLHQSIKGSSPVVFRNQVIAQKHLHISTHLPVQERDEWESCDPGQTTERRKFVS